MILSKLRRSFFGSPGFLRLFNAASVLFSVLWLPVLLVGLLAAVPAGRLVTAQRRRLGLRPRILRGTYVLPDTVYKTLADRTFGYDSYLLVWQPSYYNRRWEVPWHVRRFYAIYQLIALPRYLGFLWSLLRFDLFQYYFDHQQLYNTAVEALELPLLRLAGKRIVLAPYGGDVTLPGMRAYGGADFYELVARDYPSTGTAWWRRRVRRGVALGSRYADCVISTPPYLDVMPTVHVKYHYVAIDVAEWADHGAAPHGGRVRVVHASNHRHNKGTDLIAEVCRQLEHEGHPVEFTLLERVSREETKRICGEADIVVEQILSGSIGMFGIECMAMGKPVVAYLRDDMLEHHPWMAGCPIVDANPATLREQLLALIGDPERRERLGREGRRYAERYHSLEAIGALSDRIYRHVWDGEPMAEVEQALAERGTR